MYLHGGGYCSGVPEGRIVIVSKLLKALERALQHRRRNKTLSSPVRPVRALVLDYPLAPLHPFPAAVHGVLKALDWIDTQPGVRLSFCLCLRTDASLMQWIADLWLHAIYCAAISDLTMSMLAILLRLEAAFLDVCFIMATLTPHLGGSEPHRHRG